VCRAGRYNTLESKTFKELSPRARGRRKPDRRHVYADGAIPASAGPTSQLTARSRTSWSYPACARGPTSSRSTCHSVPATYPHVRGVGS
jgi:hypothetical protein